MSKIIMYSGSTTGTTTTGDQYAFFISELGLPTIKKGSQVISFGTSGYAMQGSSGSSGANGSSGATGTSGVSGTSGQDGAPGSQGLAGTAGSSGESGSSGINGIDGLNGSSGVSGTNGVDGTFFGSSGSSGQTGSSGSSGASGTNGLTAVGAASKGGSVPVTGFTYNATTTSWDYDVVFSTPFANTNYSVSINLFDATIDNAPDPYNYYPTFTSEKSVSGFTINTQNDPSTYPTVIFEWLAISQGETGVSGAPGSSGSAGSAGSSGLSYGSSGSSGSSGAAGATGSSGSSGAAGTSGTSSAGGGGGDTLYTQQVSVAASQPSINGSSNQWRAIYGDGNQLDQGSGGAFDTLEFGFIQPFFLAPGESIEKVGFYFMDYTSSGTAAFKVIICDKHPHAYLPWNLLHTETLTFTHDDVDNKFISWDYDFTNTGSTVNTYFVYVLFEAETTRTFELCRTVQYPQHLTYDYRFVNSSNRYDANSHWVTAYTSIYSSLPSTMSSVIASNLYYNNQRGGHMYYQTSRP